MHIVLYRMTRHLARSLKQRPDVHIETNIGKGSGDHLCSAIVTILSHLGDQNPRPPAFRLFKLRDHPLRFFELRTFATLR